MRSATALAEAEAALAAAQADQAAYRSQLPQLIAAAEADVKAAQAQQAGAAAGRDHKAEIVDAEAALAQAQFNQQRAQTSLDMMYEYNRDRRHSVRQSATGLRERGQGHAGRRGAPESVEVRIAQRPRHGRAD